jgi:solute carrier family 9B (sodium/hydrogen exchanger), member 1/2
MIIGIIMGLMGWPLNKISNPVLRNWLKFLWCAMGIIALPIGSEISGYPDAKYLGALFFGYTSYRVWGEDKPTIFLNRWWVLLEPFLFGTVGATLIVSQLNANTIKKGVVCILGGLLLRMCAAFLVVFEKKYTFKERLFISFCWVPKATVQATLSSVILVIARDRNLP